MQSIVAHNPAREPFAVARIRWGCPGDVEHCRRMEAQAHHEPSTEEEWAEMLRDRTTIVRVAEVAEQAIGFVVSRRRGQRLSIVMAIVDAQWRRRGVGTQLVDAATRGVPRCTICQADVWERNLAGQLFLRRLGWRACQIVRQPYGEINDDDAVRFVWRRGEEQRP